MPIGVPIGELLFAASSFKEASAASHVAARQSTSGRQSTHRTRGLPEPLRGAALHQGVPDELRPQDCLKPDALERALFELEELLLRLEARARFTAVSVDCPVKSWPLSLGTPSSGADIVAATTADLPTSARNHQPVDSDAIVREILDLERQLQASVLRRAELRACAMGHLGRKVASGRLLADCMHSLTSRSSALGSRPLAAQPASMLVNFLVEKIHECLEDRCRFFARYRMARDFALSMPQPSASPPVAVSERTPLPPLLAASGQHGTSAMCWRTEADEASARGQQCSRDSLALPAPSQPALTNQWDQEMRCMKAEAEQQALMEQEQVWLSSDRALLEARLNRAIGRHRGFFACLRQLEAHVADLQTRCMTSRELDGRRAERLQLLLNKLHGHSQ